MADADYEKSLDRLYMSLPATSKETFRMEIPRADSIIQGPKTMVKNFAAILKLVKRDEKDAFKFFTKELAAAGAMDEGKLVLNGKFFPEKIQQIMDAYLKEFVWCSECGKPDTQFELRQGVRMLKCTACGAVRAVRRI